MMRGVKSGEENNMDTDRTVRIVTGLALTLVAIGIIANLKDIRRYLRISMM
jgi:hypothetical protein